MANNTDDTNSRTDTLSRRSGEHGGVSLYELIGEESGIHVFIEQFYHALLAEAQLRPFLERKDIAVLKAEQKEFIAVVLGGRPPLDYWDLISSDAPPDLTLGHTELLIEYAEAVLLNMDLDHDVVKSIVRILSPFIEAFIGGSSSALANDTRASEEPASAQDIPPTTAAPPLSNTPLGAETRYKESEEEKENARKFREIIQERLQQAQITSPLEHTRDEAAEEISASQATTPEYSSTLTKSKEETKEFLKDLELMLSELSATSDEAKRLLIEEQERNLKQPRDSWDDMILQKAYEDVSKAHLLSAQLMEKVHQQKDADLSKRSGQEAFATPYTSLNALISHNQEFQSYSYALHSISSRTATLALNAALEAARAGQEGKCFGVIASEIKELAKNAEELAKRISKTFKACRYYAHESLSSLDANGRYTNTDPEIARDLSSLAEHLAQAAARTSSDIHLRQSRELSTSTSSMGTKKELSRFAEKLYQIGKKIQELRLAILKSSE